MQLEFGIILSTVEAREERGDKKELEEEVKLGIGCCDIQIYLQIYLACTLGCTAEVIYDACSYLHVCSAIV